jgi:hypothetical protein
MAVRRIARKGGLGVGTCCGWSMRRPGCVSTGQHYVRLPNTVMDEAERIRIQKLLTEEAEA